MVTHLKYINDNKDFLYFKGNSALAKWWKQHKQNTCVVLHQPFTGYNSQFLFVDKHSSVYGFEELLSAGGDHSWGKKCLQTTVWKALGYSSVWSFNYDTHGADNSDKSRLRPFSFLWISNFGPLKKKSIYQVN